MTRTIERYVAILVMAFLLFSSFDAICSTTDEIDAIINKIAIGKDISVDSVRYTGSDGRKAGGFYFQQGIGQGWTMGQRFTIRNVAPDVVREVSAKFDDLIEKEDGYSNERLGCLFYKSLKTFYGFEYSSDENTLWLLKAVTSGDICIPSAWKDKTFVDATEYDPLKDVDRTRLKMLGLSRLWAAVDRWFVFRNKMTENWDSIYVAMMPEMLAAENEQDWTRVLDKMVAHAHDGHTFVYSYHDKRVEAPFTTVFVDGSVFVADVFDKGVEIKPGDKIIGIDNIPVIDYASQYVSPYIASSTPQWTVHETFDGSGLLRRNPTDTVRIEFENGKKIEYVAGDFGDDNRSVLPTFKFSWLTDRIAYLKITSFMSSDFKDKCDCILDSIQGSEALVIDLRDNDGGNSGNGDYLLQRICSDTIPTGRWESPMTVPAFTSWGQILPPYWGGGEGIAPLTDLSSYSNPIVVLIDRGTFSAAEDFVSRFRGAKRGIVIGTPSGGSTGNGVCIELIRGHSMANICSKHDLASDGTEFVGIGIIPDIIVHETWQSIFSDKIDASTSKAVSYLEEILSNQPQ